MPKAKPQKPQRTDPLPILLPRKQWEHVLHCLKSTIGVTEQKLNHIRDGLKQEGASLVIEIAPDGVKWIACEVLRGSELGAEVYRQWHFLMVCEARTEPKEQFLFFDGYDGVP